MKLAICEYLLIKASNLKHLQENQCKSFVGDQYMHFSMTATMPIIVSVQDYMPCSWLEKPIKCSIYFSFLWNFNGHIYC